MPGFGWEGFGLDYEADDTPEIPGVNQGSRRGVTKSPKRKKRRNR